MKQTTKADVLLGLQWGDEGKGKIVDVLTPNYDMIARFQGGPNAGHTLEFNGIKHVLHTIPSGIFRKDTINLVGNGVVIDPVIFKKELEALVELNVDFSDSLVISRRASLILPTHRFLDAASEQAKGKEKIGSTLRGIGPTYMDKTGRNGLRVGDIFLPDFEDRYKKLVDKHARLLSFYNYEYDLKEAETAWFAAIDEIRKMTIVDSEQVVNDYLARDQRVLAEGAQGTLLDIDFGSYPFVTSSNTIAAGACTGLGIAPNNIGEVFGIFKAYCTRVGSGPFPTELNDESGEALRKAGNEFGATTGRPRRCGWLDLPALRYAVMINGVTQLIMMKADVLSGLKTIKVATAYRLKDGSEVTHFPYDISDGSLEPVYTELPGWDEDLTGVRDLNDLPAQMHSYIDFLEKELNVPIRIVSVGPDRTQTLMRSELAV